MILSEKVVSWLEDMKVTKEVFEAIFILEDGTLIDGEFDYGMRGIDHNCIISLAPPEMTQTEKWKHIHEVYKVVRLVPETGVALIDEDQELNNTQESMIEGYYEVERY